MGILEEYEIEMDPRLKRASKEMIITFGFCISYTIMVLAVAWRIGMPISKVPQYHYILGFPAWIFWALIVIPLVFFGIMALIVTIVFKDDSLEPWLVEKRD